MYWLTIIDCIHHQKKINRLYDMYSVGVIHSIYANLTCDTLQENNPYGGEKKTHTQLYNRYINYSIDLKK